jgi:hypothetical protein
VGTKASFRGNTDIPVVTNLSGLLAKQPLELSQAKRFSQRLRTNPGKIIEEGLGRGRKCLSHLARPVTDFSFGRKSAIGRAGFDTVLRPLPPMFQKMSLIGFKTCFGRSKSTIPGNLSKTNNSQISNFGISVFQAAGQPT